LKLFWKEHKRKVLLRRYILQKIKLEILGLLGFQRL